MRSAESGWGSGEVLGILALAAVLLVGFVVIEHRSAEPLVRLSIFSVRTVRGANVAMLVVACGLFAMFFFNTLFVQRVLGYSPLEAGLAFLPFTAGIIIGSVASQQLIPRLGAREVPVIGLAIAVVGMLLFLRLSPDSTYVADILPGIMLASIGMGLTFVPVTLIATSGVPVDDAGLASGLFNTSQQIGGALGLALLSTFAANKTADVLVLGAGQADARPRRRRRSSTASTSPGSAVRALPRRGRRAALRAAPPRRRARRRRRRGRAGRHVGGAAREAAA